MHHSKERSQLFLFFSVLFMFCIGSDILLLKWVEVSSILSEKVGYNYWADAGSGLAIGGLCNLISGVLPAPL